MKTVLILSALALSFVAPSSMACSCAPPPPVEEALNASTAVFLGTVSAIKYPGVNAETVHFKVEKDFKGLPWQSTTATYGSKANGANCGYMFQQGKQYIVYASLDSEGRLATNICTRTKSATSPDGKDEILELEKL